MGDDRPPDASGAFVSLFASNPSQDAAMDTGISMLLPQDVVDMGILPSLDLQLLPSTELLTDYATGSLPSANELESLVAQLQNDRSLIKKEGQASVVVKTEPNGSGSGGSSLATPPSEMNVVGHNKGGTSRSLKKKTTKEKNLTQTERNREAQRRFRERQKSKRTELETELDILNAQLEKTRLEADEAQKRAMALESALAFREQQLMAAQQDNTGGEGHTSTPVLVTFPVAPEMIALMQEHAPHGVYNLETLLRHAPAGYTGHMGPDGLARQAPPIEKLNEEWNMHLRNMRIILNAASSGAAHPEEKGTLEEAEVPESINPATITIFSGNILYKFTDTMLKEMGNLLYRAGLLGWQQVALFPDQWVYWSSIRRDTCQYLTNEELHDTGFWHSVVDKLDLRPDQLEAIAGHYKTYIDTLTPVLDNRLALKMHATTRPVENTDYEFLETGKISAALSESLLKERMCRLVLMCQFKKCLDFPVQQSRFFTLTYPYSPQLDAMGEYASKKAGYEFEKSISFGQQTSTSQNSGGQSNSGS